MPITLEKLLNTDNGNISDFEKEILVLLPSVDCSTEECCVILKSKISNIRKSQNFIKVASNVLLMSINFLLSNWFLIDGN